MERNEEREESARAGADKDDDKRQGGVVDYLQAPKKKRKSYVVIALGKGVNADLAGMINGFVRSQYKQFAVSVPKSPEELARQAARNIALIILDDEFADLEKCLATVKTIKQKKNDTTVPVLFLTRRAEDLVSAYNKTMVTYHECDEYITHVVSTQAQVFNRIKLGLENNNRRRSRRYKVDISCRYSILGQEESIGGEIRPKMIEGKIVDLSVHGALLKAPAGQTFKTRDQIKVHLPITLLLPPVDGDILRLSAKIRRIFISGDLVGVSFEHVSDRQQLILTQFVTELVEGQVTKKIPMPVQKGNSPGKT